jgi:hypothetical protein
MGSRDHDWGGEHACVAFVAFVVYGARRRLDCFSLLHIAKHLRRKNFDNGNLLLA